LLFAISAFGQDAGPEKYAGIRIARVAFEPQPQPLPDSELSSLVPLHPGDLFRPELLHDALNHLNATGEYTDIAVDASLDNGEVVVRFLTKSAFFVGSVSVEGVATPPNEGQVLAETKLRLGAPFSEPDVVGATENLQDLLRRNGFYNADIRSQVDRDPATRQVKIHFTVDTGKRARFDGLLISGNPGRPTASIMRTTKWKRFGGRLNWQPITEARVQSGVSAVLNSYRNKDYLLARVSLTKLEYHSDTNTVTPSLEIEPGPRVVVSVAGMRLAKGKRRQLFPVYQEQALDKDLLNEGVRNLTEYLWSQGYFDARVDYFEDSATASVRNITYTVDRGVRHRLSKLTIEGNKFFDTGTIRDRMSVIAAVPIRYPYGRYSPKALARDVQSIKDLYQSNGFREVEVTSRQEDHDRGGRSDLSVYVDIKEGPQWFVSNLTFAGLPPADLEAVKPLVQSAAGQIYSEVNIAADRDKLLEYFFDRGYANATFDFNAKSSGDRTIDLTYHVNPGSQQFVRGVLVGGLVHTNPNLVTSRISLTAGDPLSLAKMAGSQRRLNDLGIFSNVQTGIENPDGVELSKYALFRMEEASRYSFNVGFGAQFGRIGSPASTLDSPAGTNGFSPLVSLGVNRINFLGLGHTVGIQTKVSTVDQRALFSYVAPQFKGSPDLNLQFNVLFDRAQDIRTFDSQRLEGSIQLGQRITKALSFQYRVAFRKVIITGQPLLSPALIELLIRPVRVGSFSASLIHDRRDNLLDPSRGVYSTLTVETASGVFGSQTEFVRVQGTNSTYYRLAKNLIFARSTSFGANLRYAGNAEIPLAEHLFSGGASSDRAFPENQAGPRDPLTGFPLGGNALLFNNSELRFPLIGDNLGGVLFHDIGNVYTDIHSISLRYTQHGLQDFNYAVQGFGFGIRYRTPVGPLRVDLSLSPNSPRFFGYKGTYDDLINNLGQPVNQRINIFQFHFSLGQTF
jgi:outer membrane protein assembly complex protein YaeT